MFVAFPMDCRPGGIIVGLKLRALVPALMLAVPALAQEAPPPAPPTTPAPPAAAPAPAQPAAPAAPAALTEAGAAALQQAKDAFRAGHLPEALEASLKVLAEQPNNPEGLYIAGVCERQQNQLDAAAGHLTTLLGALPNFKLGHFQLGYVLFLQAESLARESGPDAAKAEYSTAADEFGKELAINPSYVPAISSFALSLARAGRTDEAIKAYEPWIAAAPEKNEPVVSLAVTDAVAGKSSEAMAALDRLPVKDTKAVVDAATAVATIFTLKKDWGAAVPFLEKAVAVDPASAHARALLTQAYARAIQYDDAAKSLTTLLTMDAAPEDAELAGEAIKATIGDGHSATSVPGVDPPGVLKLPAPRYPKGQDAAVETEVLVLTRVSKIGAILETLMVPNRIWKDLRSEGYEGEAFDAVKRGKFAPGQKDGQTAELWVVVSVKFSRK
jgi:tetratricopeptide (TPR) repeat protein